MKFHKDLKPVQYTLLFLISLCVILFVLLISVRERDKNTIKKLTSDLRMGSQANQACWLQVSKLNKENSKLHHEKSELKGRLFAIENYVDRMNKKWRLDLK